MKQQSLDQPVKLVSGEFMRARALPPIKDFNGLVERLLFHPQGDWLLAAGGANDGFLLFFDLKSKKVLRQEKSPAHLFAAVLNESGDTIYAAGHHQVVVFEMKA